MERYIDEEDLVCDIVSEWSYQSTDNSHTNQHEIKIFLRIVFTSVAEKVLSFDPVIQQMLYFQVKSEYLVRECFWENQQVLEFACLQIQSEFTDNLEKAILEMSTIFFKLIPLSKLKEIDAFEWVSQIANNLQKNVVQSKQQAISSALAYYSLNSADLLYCLQFTVQVRN